MLLIKINGDLINAATIKEVVIDEGGGKILLKFPDSVENVILEDGQFEAFMKLVETGAITLADLGEAKRY